MLQHPKNTEDVLQEVLIQMSDSLPDYRGQGFKTWITRITVNKAIDFKRKAYENKEEPTDQNMAQEEWGKPEADTVEEEVLRKERNQRIRQKINELPPKFKEVVYAYYIEGKSYQEIADTLQLEYKSVESRLYRARKWIQKNWKEHDVW